MTENKETEYLFGHPIKYVEGTKEENEKWDKFMEDWMRSHSRQEEIT